MKNLNKKSTEIFCRLMDNMTDHDCLVIENEPYMTLKLEKVRPKVNLFTIPNRKFGCIYSLMQSYTDIDGTLIIEPEMHFVVIDYRLPDGKDNNILLVVPFLNHITLKGIHETSMLFHDKRKPTYDAQKQAAHTALADNWFTEIYEQGFLDACIY